MGTTWALGIILAAIWGVAWALFLQFHRDGQWLATQRTWVTVLVGIGVDVLIMGTILDPHALLIVLSIIAASSVGIIARSLYNERAAESDAIERLFEHQDE